MLSRTTLKMFSTYTTPRFNTLKQLVTHINTNKIYGRKCLIPILNGYQGQDWKIHSNKYVYKDNLYQIQLKSWKPLEHTKWCEDDLSIYKILNGRMSQELILPDFEESCDESEKIKFLLGCDDVFLSHSLHKIRNDDIHSTTLQIKLL